MRELPFMKAYLILFSNVAFAPSEANTYLDQCCDWRTQE